MVVIVAVCSRCQFGRAARRADSESETSSADQDTSCRRRQCCALRRYRRKLRQRKNDFVLGSRIKQGQPVRGVSHVELGSGTCPCRAWLPCQQVGSLRSHPQGRMEKRVDLALRWMALRLGSSPIRLQELGPVALNSNVLPEANRWRYLARRRCSRTPARTVWRSRSCSVLNRSESLLDPENGLLQIPI